MMPVIPSRRTVAIFGATSDIAVAVARLCARTGDRLLLVGRNMTELRTLGADLLARGAVEIAVQEADFARIVDLPGVAEAAWDRFGGIDVALLAYAVQPDRVAAEQDAGAAEAALVINFVSPAVLLGELARRFKAQGSGTIAAITSVAGDRARKNNYVYGAAKGGLQRFLEGLHLGLHGAGVAVIDIRPGFVRTKMTADQDRNGPLWATTDQVSCDIVRAIGARRPVLYTPWFWRIIMAVVRVLPRSVYQRISF